MILVRLETVRNADSQHVADVDAGWVKGSDAQGDVHGQDDFASFPGFDARSVHGSVAAKALGRINASVYRRKISGRWCPLPKSMDYRLLLLPGREIGQGRNNYRGGTVREGSKGLRHLLDGQAIRCLGPLHRNSHLRAIAGGICQPVVIGGNGHRRSTVCRFGLAGFHLRPKGVGQDQEVGRAGWTSKRIGGSGSWRLLLGGHLLNRARPDASIADTWALKPLRCRHTFYGNTGNPIASVGPGVAAG